MSGKQVILLLAHGSPERAEDIPEYLRNVTSGRPLPESVAQEVQHRYSLIGRSPLTEITMRQAEAVACASGYPVYVGMRNWRPYIRDAVARMAEDGVTHVVAICLAPHSSQTSVGLYRRAVTGENGYVPFALDFVESWHDHPLLIEAFAQKLQLGWERACHEAARKLPVIFTAHSVPRRTIAEGDLYEKQTRETATLVAKSVPQVFEGEWRFAFQSQGMSGGEWLGPTVEETIRSLKEAGQAGVFVQPIGFVCDHVEVLYDVDIGFRQFAEKLGMRLWRAESLNDSPAFVRAVSALALDRLRNVTGAPGSAP